MALEQSSYRVQDAILTALKAYLAAAKMQQLTRDEPQFAAAYRARAELRRLIGTEALNPVQEDGA